MATVSRPNTYAPGDEIVSDEVNNDFDTVYSAANNLLVHVDGSKAFTGIPVLPATDPSSDNQAARKKYVDARTAGVLAKHVIPNVLVAVPSNALGDMGVILNFTMPDLSDGSRAVRIDFGAFGLQFAGPSDNTSTVEIRMVRGNETGTVVTMGSFTKANGLLNGPRIEMSGFLFNNGLWAAGVQAAVRMYGVWSGGPSGGTTAVSGSPAVPAVAVVSLI